MRQQRQVKLPKINSISFGGIVVAGRKAEECGARVSLLSPETAMSV